MPVDGQFNPILEDDLLTGYEYTTSDDDTGATNTVTLTKTLRSLVRLLMMEKVIPFHNKPPLMMTGVIP